MIISATPQPSLSNSPSMKELILAQDVRSTGQIYVGWTAVIAPDEKALAEPGGQGRK